MSYWKLVLAGTRRKPARVVLIALQVAVAFTLFGLLQGLLTAVHDAVQRMRPDVLVVRRATDGGSLPLGMYEQLRRIDGVGNVTYLAGLPATYGNGKADVFAIVTQIDQWLRVVPGFYVSPQAVDALRRMKTGALVSTAIAKHFGWRVGDRVILESSRWPMTNGSNGWPFDIVGTFDMDRHAVANEFLIVNYDYFNENRISDRDTVRAYYVKAISPRQAPFVGDLIDKRFANSGNETQTESMREEGERAMRTVGDVGFLVRAVLGAVFFSLLFSVGALIVQSVLERQPEFGILRTIGFKNRQVFGVLLAETVLVCAIPALIGLGLADLLMPLTTTYTQLDLRFPIRVYVFGFALAVLLGTVTSVLPGIRAARLQIIEALRRS